MTNDPVTSDDDMLALLRSAFRGFTPGTVPADAEPPPSLLEGSLWVHQWHNMESELAELTYDSSVQSPVSVRSGSSLRQLTFRSGDRSIEMAIEPAGRSVVVSGEISPPLIGTMQLLVGGEMFVAEIDPSGSFIVEDVPFGTVLAFVATTGMKIRLGAFEV